MVSLSYFTFCYPYYILTIVFCAAMMLLYPNVLFEDKKIKIVGTVVIAVLITVITIMTVMNPLRYSTDLLSSVDGKDITSEYQGSLADDKYGDVSIEKPDWSDSCVVHADFKKRGNTELIIKTPDGTTKKYDLNIELLTYELNEK